MFGVTLELSQAYRTLVGTLDEDIARLSAYVCKHINVHGHYSFRLPELSGTGRPLRDPDHADPDEDD